MVAAPVVFSLLLAGQGAPAWLLLLVATLTDIADGRLARRFGTASRNGALFDVWADFLLVMAAFWAMCLVGKMDIAALAAIAAAFGLFLLTARRRTVIYDPIGRHLGGVLMVLALVSVAIPDPLFLVVVGWVIISACGFTIFARLASIAFG